MMTESHVAVRYPDCDPMGIVHHGVYPIWYEIARMDFFAALGYPYEAMHKEGINPPMVNLNLHYHSAVRYPGNVTVRTVCTLCQGKKLELRYAVYQEGNPAPVASATSFHIWTGPDMKSLDMQKKPEVYEKLQRAVTRPAVLILAGGRSSRMGTDKAGLELDGKSMLDRAVSFWKSVLPEATIYIAAGQPEHFDSLPPETIPVYDLLPDRGPLGGLHAAFHRTEESLLLVSAVDMPFLSEEALEALEAKRNGCEDACVFTRGDQPEPLFGFYRSSCLPQIDKLLAQGEHRMSALLGSVKTTLVPLKHSDWVQNINTPEDWNDLKKKF